MNFTIRCVCRVRGMKVVEEEIRVFSLKKEVIRRL